MSKKKATMTLKDFHGGSIPSDLPLPSAPGVIVRPSERSSYDRQTSWGNPLARPDHRLRPGSAGSVRTFDDKAPFMSNSSHIGRNFDEDERKPLDGISGPRRTFSDDNVRGSSSHVVEPKANYLGPGKSASQLVPTSGKQPLTVSGSNSYVGRLSDAKSGVASGSSVVGGPGGGLSYQNIGGPTGQLVSGSSPNAWGLKKEAASMKDPTPALSSSFDAALKLAHASALEKVSTGRWHTKQPDISPPDIGGTRHAETEGELYTKEKTLFNKNPHSTPAVVEGMDYRKATYSKQVEKSGIVDNGINYGGKEAPKYERTLSSVQVEVNGRTSSGSLDGAQPPRLSVKPSGYESQPAVVSDASERPKLKLLPRSKPLDAVEQPVDYKQGYQHPPVPAENLGELHGKNDLVKAALVGPDNETPNIERPKLNLKPRSGAVEHFDGHVEGKRNTLFGGARPRELVLKERGIDDIARNIEDLAQPPYRTKQDGSKIEKRSAPSATAHHNQKPENIAIEQRKGKNYDKRDLHLDAEKTDVQRRNWRGDNWKNKKELEKQHNPQQLQQERPPSPETWRKPVVEQPRPASADASGMPHPKAASAVELAQAFSRSISDTPVVGRFGEQRGLPNRQVPFSRLMAPSSRPQINGY